MNDYDRNILDKLEDIHTKRADCIDEYESIKSECPKVLMSITRKTFYDYGMFTPDEELTKYCRYKGKLTKDEKLRDFTYYFDSENKLRLTERYIEGNKSEIIFYYYQDNCIEAVWYSVSDKKIINVCYAEYINNKLLRFVESTLVLLDYRRKQLNYYREYLFNDKDYITFRGFDGADINAWCLDGSIHERSYRLKRLP